MVDSGVAMLRGGFGTMQATACTICSILAAMVVGSSYIAAERPLRSNTEFCLELAREMVKSYEAKLVTLMQTASIIKKCYKDVRVHTQ